MIEVGSYEAKTHLPKLLSKVASGEHVTITRHGMPVALLVPPHAQTGKSPLETIADLRVFRKGRTLKGISLRELIEEGRR